MATTQKVKRKEVLFVQINTRIRKDQSEYIKKVLKKRNPKAKPGDRLGDAILHREMFDYYIKNHKI